MTTKVFNYIKHNIDDIVITRIITQTGMCFYRLRDTKISNDMIMFSSDLPLNDGRIIIYELNYKDIKKITYDRK